VKKPLKKPERKSIFWNEIALFGMKLTYFELKLIKGMFQE
jgi:hypothetical protein